MLSQLLVLLPSLVLAQAPVDGGSPASGPARRSASPGPSPADAAAPSPGTTAAGAADGGTPASAQSTLVPPSLAVDSPATYPEALRAAGRGGRVELMILVDAEGSVEQVEVVSSDDEAFSAAALEAATGLRFTPATLDGVPVPVRAPFTYAFAPPAARERLPVAVLTGRVRAQGSRQKIPGAALHVQALPAPVLADAEGAFSLALPPGTHEVCVTSPGHARRCFTESLVDGQQLEVRYALMPDVVNPYETVVRGERERVEVSSVRLRDAELREVPGTMGDPFRVVMLMPGVASVGSGIAYPVVRGTQPAATGYFIDGVRVPALFHMALGPSIVHPEFLDGINFYPGAPPARFGRLLGGVVEGRVSRPREDRIHATASVDLINAGAYLELPIEATGTSITLAGRYSYTGWLLAALSKATVPASPSDLPQPDPVADFADYQARIEQKLGAGRLRLLAFGATDTVGTRASADDQFTGTIGQYFHRLDLRWTQPLAGGELEAGLTGGYDRMGIFGEQDRKPFGEFSVGQVMASARLGYRRELGNNLTFESGAELEHRRASTRIAMGELDVKDQAGVGEDPLRNPQALGNFGSLWAEGIWKPGIGWTVVPGVRLDSYKLLGGGLFLAPEPRLSVRRQLDEHWTLKGGAGLFHQQPTVLISMPVVDVAGLGQGLQQGVQIDAGAEWTSTTGLDLSADVYFNPLIRTVEFSLEQTLQNRRRRGAPVPDLSSRGHSYGFELLARHPLGGNWFGWVSYSFNQSVRDTRFTRYAEDTTPEETVVEPLAFAFEQAHVLNAALSVQLPGRWTLGAVFHLNTGRPESGEISSRTNRIVGDTSTDAWGWFPEDRDRVNRLPTFWRVDARISKDWVFDDWSLQAYLDVFNLTVQQEVLAYTYGTTHTGAPNAEPLKIPLVVPMLGLKGSY